MSKMPNEISIDPVSPEYLVTMARAVLEVEHQQIHTTPVGAVVIGWLRAAHDQILAIGEMVRDGRTSATGPNVRTVMEVTLRLLWLLGLTDRAAGLRAQFEDEARKANNHPQHLKDMGFNSVTFTEAPPRINLDLQFGPLDTKLQGVASRVFDFSKVTKDAGGFYDTWQAATQFNHATAALAEAYAPRTAFGNFADPQEPIDWSGHLNGVSMVICGVAAQILVDEGVDRDTALSFFVASASA